MSKSIFWLIGLWLVASLSIVSCSESDGEADPYTNWRERNQRYIDSIATVAEAHQGNEVGQWKIIRSYKLPDPGLGETGRVNDNVYCKILKVGDGTVSPLFTDSVNVHYRGKFIPLYNGEEVVFDQSFQGELNDETINTITPSGFRPSGVVTGWTTALQEMKEGDYWEVYLPYQLGYGVSDYNSIPGYSTLLFTIYLQKVIPLEPTGKSVAGEPDESL